MVAILSKKNELHSRGEPQEAVTTFTCLEYDAEHDYSLLRAVITKGVRHQIRVHAKALGYPIIGDHIYGTKDHEEVLHLWSVGCEVKL